MCDQRSRRQKSLGWALGMYLPCYLVRNPRGADRNSKTAYEFEACLPIIEAHGVCRRGRISVFECSKRHEITTPESKSAGHKHNTKVWTHPARSRPLSSGSSTSLSVCLCVCSLPISLSPLLCRTLSAAVSSPSRSEAGVGRYSERYRRNVLKPSFLFLVCLRGRRRRTRLNFFSLLHAPPHTHGNYTLDNRIHVFIRVRSSTTTQQDAGNVDRFGERGRERARARRETSKQPEEVHLGWKWKRWCTIEAAVQG